MESTRKRTLITTAVAGAGAAAALGIALAASPAQAEDPTPTPSASSSAPAADKPDREAARAARQDELAGALAAELGIDKAKVAAALEKVQAAQRDEAKADRQAQLKTRLDEAVKAGKLTADEAAAILKAAEAGVLPQGGGPGGHRGGPGR